jgi:hypothetical protein
VFAFHASQPLLCQEADNQRRKKSIMMNRCFRLILLTGTAMLAASGVPAQVSSINAAVVQPRVFNDDPTSDFSFMNNYPTSIMLNDQSVNGDGTGGEFANRHVWNFSNDGTTNFRFTNNSFFDVFMEVTLEASPISPRKEAGFLLDTIGGQGQFIVNTDAHEVVAFGGPLPFYAFPRDFDAGETIRLGMTYFQDFDGKRKIIYHAGGASSPALEFGNLEQGIIDNSTLGGYLQVNILSTDPANFGKATYANIGIEGLAAVVPEPSALLALSLGIVLPGLLRRRRRRA